MIAGIHISQEIFAIDTWTALKPSLKHDRKHVLRLLRLYGDQALAIILQPTGEKNRSFYIFVASNNESFISQTLKVVGLLREKLYLFIPLRIQIETDFDPTNTRIKLHSFKALT